MQNMRILQIIDSLQAGGAERMAANYANALSDQIDFSGLVATRTEGPLRQQLDTKVSYLFLNKKMAFDIPALLRLRKYVIQNRVNIIHAHSTSFFTAVLLKFSCPSLKLVWHDHYGESEFLDKRPVVVLKMLLPFFNGIVVVNQKLKLWITQKIKFKNCIYLPNFPAEEKEITDKTILKGIEGKRIVVLANLRPQKDHFLLLEVAKKLKDSHPDWTFHLIGKDFEDYYSQQIKKLILQYDLEKTVYLYGSKQDIKNILDKSTIGLLTSKSEGLPVALLEYGWLKLPVVVTQVGEIPALIENGKNGFMVPPANPNFLYEALVSLIESDALRNDFGMALHRTIIDNYAKSRVIQKYLNWVQNY